MGPKMMSSSSIALLVAFAIISTACNAHNITKILEKDPTFSTFNQMLTDTGLAKEINSRRTITVLAISNDHLGSLNGKSADELTNILETHIVLDYFDSLKLANLKGKSTTMTTMFQSTGVAHYSQGFLNVTKTADGIIFGSAVKDSPRDVKYLGSVASLPYNISVLSVSGPISTPGLDGSEIVAPPPTSAVAPPPKKAKEEVFADDAESPAEPESPPQPEGEAPAPAPGAVADAPVADAPKAAADDADDTEKTPASSAGKMVVSTIGVASVVISCIVFL